MKNYINLNSNEWCDIVFDDRNKEYGAYAMRQTSGKRHIIAFGAMLIFTAFVSVLPTLIDFVKEATTVKVIDKYDGGYTISKVEVKLPEPILPDLVIPEPPKPIARATFKFVAPVITDDALVNEDNMLKAVDDLKDKRLAISSIENLLGNPDLDAPMPTELITQVQIMNTPTIVEPVSFVEQMPEYMHGEAAMYKYIADNLRYPVQAIEAGIQGRVFIRFVVTTTGSIENVEVMRGIDSACDKEAMRVIKLMSKSWIPGRQNGKAVPVYFSIPVMFKLQS